MSAVDGAARVMVVVCDVEWDRRHPGLTAAAVAAACREAGLEVHEVPLPSDTSTVLGSLGAAHAISSMPTDRYGDLVIGIGHLSALLRHERTLLLVDDGCVDALRPGAESTGPRVQGLLRDGLMRAGAVGATTARSLDAVRRHRRGDGERFTSAHDVGRRATEAVR